MRLIDVKRNRGTELENFRSKASLIRLGGSLRANIASVLANPMPDAAPVTTATLPSNSFAICLHRAGVATSNLSSSCWGKARPLFGAFHRRKGARLLFAAAESFLPHEERPLFAHLRHGAMSQSST